LSSTYHFSYNGSFNLYGNKHPYLLLVAAVLALH